MSIPEAAVPSPLNLRLFSKGPSFQTGSSPNTVSPATTSAPPPLEAALQTTLASNLHLCRQGALGAHSVPSPRSGNTGRPRKSPLLPCARTISLPWPARHSISHNATFKHLLLLPGSSIHVHHQTLPSYSLRLHSSPSGLQDLLDSQLHLPALITKHRGIFELFPVSAPHTPHHNG